MRVLRFSICVGAVLCVAAADAGTIYEGLSTGVIVETRSDRVRVGDPIRFWFTFDSEQADVDPSEWGEYPLLAASVRLGNEELVLSPLSRRAIHIQNDVEYPRTGLPIDIYAVSVYPDDASILGIGMALFDTSASLYSSDSLPPPPRLMDFDETYFHLSDRNTLPGRPPATLALGEIHSLNFIVIPEPTSGMLAMIAALALIHPRRRRILGLGGPGL